MQGHNWLPNTGWAISNAAYCGVPKPAGGSFYSAKNWVGNSPPCPPATYAPGYEIDLRVIFYERPKLGLGLDVETDIQILKVM